MVEIPHNEEEPVFKLISTLTPTPRKRGRPPTANTQTKVSRRRPTKQKFGLNTSTSENSEVVHEEPNQNVRAIVTHTGIPTFPNINIVENDENQESEGIEEISTNYMDTSEAYNKETIADRYFAEKIEKIFYIDVEPKPIAECKHCSDWIKWKETIKLSRPRLVDNDRSQRQE
jgi:hypothetical protein